MLNISQKTHKRLKKIYFGEHFFQKSGNSKYCNFVNSKLCHGLFFANFTNFSEGHLEGRILPMSKSEQMLS